MPDLILLGTKLLELFKKIGASKPNIDKSTGKNFITNIGGTVHQQQIIYVASGREATEKEKEDFRKIIGGQPFVLDVPEVTEKKAILATKSGGDTDLLKFVLKSLPPKDHSLWRAGLLLRKYFRKGQKDIVIQIKGDMIISDPIRGKNIANLCNENYLESEIIPIHKALTDLERSDDFVQFYEALVTQTPTSIFVGFDHNEKNLKAELLRKIDYAQNYSAPYIRVHALGKHHVALAKKVLKEIRSDENIEDIHYLPSQSHLNAMIMLSKKE